MPQPEYRVFIDWENNGNFTGTYDNVTDDVEGQVEIIRGLSDVHSGLFIGSCNFSLRNYDQKYSPENTSSVVYPYVLPNRPVKIEVEYDSVTYVRFIGRTSKFVPDASLMKPRVRVDCRDRMYELSKILLSKIAQPNDYIDDFLKAIFAKIPIPTSEYDITHFEAIPNIQQFTRQSEYIARDLAGILSEIINSNHSFIEIGLDDPTPKIYLYSYRFGEGRDAAGTLKTPYGTYYDTEDQADVYLPPSSFTYDIDKIYNSILAEAEDSILWTFDNPASITKYGERQLNILNGTMQNFDVQAVQEMANYFLSYYKDLWLVSNLVLKDKWPDIAQINLGEVLTIYSTQLDFNHDFIVRSYTEMVDIQGHTCSVTYNLSQKRSGSFGSPSGWGTGGQAFEMSQLENGYDYDGRYFEYGQTFQVPWLLDVLTEMRFDVKQVSPSESGLIIRWYDNDTGILLYESSPITSLITDKRTTIKVTPPENKELSQYSAVRAMIEWIDPPANPFAYMGGESVYYNNITINNASSIICWAIGKEEPNSTKGYSTINQKFVAPFTGAPRSFTANYNIHGGGLGSAGGLNITCWDENFTTIIAESVGVEPYYQSPNVRGNYKIDFQNVYGILEQGQTYNIEIVPRYPQFLYDNKHTFISVNGRYLQNENIIQPTQTWLYNYESLGTQTFYGDLPVSGDVSTIEQYGNIGLSTNLCLGKNGKAKILKWQNYLYSSYGNLLYLKIYNTRVSGKTPAQLVSYKVFEDFWSGQYGRFFFYPNINVEEQFSLAYEKGSNYPIDINNYIDYDITDIEYENYNDAQISWNGSNWSDGPGFTYNKIRYEELQLQGYFQMDWEIEIETGGKLIVYGDGSNFYPLGQMVANYRSGGATVFDDSTFVNYDTNFGFKVR